jgi:hypothetical protein
MISEERQFERETVVLGSFAVFAHRVERLYQLFWYCDPGFGYILARAGSGSGKLGGADQSVEDGLEAIESLNKGSETLRHGSENLESNISYLRLEHPVSYQFGFGTADLANSIIIFTIGIWQSDPLSLASPEANYSGDLSASPLFDDRNIAIDLDLSEDLPQHAKNF